MKNFTKKIVVISLCVSILSLSSIAQVTDFKMNDYKYRTKGIKAIGLNVGTNSAVVAGPAKSVAFGLSPTTAYTKQYSLDNKQLEFWNWSSLSVSKPAVKDQPISWMVGTRINWTQRLYKGNKYIQFGSNTSINANNAPAPIIPNPLDSSGKENENPKFYNVGLNPHVGVGQGRLEYISNAQMALFILEDLKEAGKIKGTVSKDATYKFTELITQLYNTRIFDFRVRRNYEVAKIDSFLRSNKIISATDVKTYNIIADNWNYAIQPQAIESTYDGYTAMIGPSSQAVSDRINQFGVFGQAQRYAGTRTSIIVDFPSSVSNSGFTQIGYGGESNYFNMNDTSIDKVTYTVKGLNVTGTWQKHQALSLHLQQVLTGWVNFGSAGNNMKATYINNKPDSVNKSTNSTLGLGASFGYSLFPNSRTVVSTVSSLSVNRNTNKTGAVETKTNVIALRGVVKGNYFLNYKSRISGTVELGYNSQASSLVVNGLTTYAQKGINFNFMLTYVNYLF
jgi:hypothetical protein